jgi:hypothetical protein
MYTARWIPLNLLQNSPVQVTAVFRVMSELVTVYEYCSCPGILLHKTRLLYALHSLTLGKKNAFWPHIVSVHLKLLYEKSTIICLKLSDFFNTKVQCHLLHTFVLYTQHAKHLIRKLSVHEEISKCRCLDTQFLKLYLILYF